MIEKIKAMNSVAVSSAITLVVGIGPVIKKSL